MRDNIFVFAVNLGSSSTVQYASHDVRLPTRWTIDWRQPLNDQGLIIQTLGHRSLACIPPNRSDVTTSGQPRHGRSRSRQERRPESRERRSSLSSSSPRNNPLTTASQAGAESISKGVQKKRVTGRNGREQQNLDREMELTLSSSDDDDNTATQKSCLKPPPTSATQSPHSGKTKKGDGHYQAGDEVEARFGGRSKWFAGKVTLAYSRDAHVGEVYDIAYDDGDTEEAVLAARVRRPGQSPPSPRTGVAIDVKLARKGKVMSLPIP